MQERQGLVGGRLMDTSWIETIHYGPAQRSIAGWCQRWQMVQKKLTLQFLANPVYPDSRRLAYATDPCTSDSSHEKLGYGLALLLRLLRGLAFTVPGPSSTEER
jgi:hypothetical protein